MIFHVEAAGEFRPVNLTFAAEADVRRVRAWRKITSDAGEFAASAAKRWFRCRVLFLSQRISIV
jgi:hypothetical protein